MPLSLKNILKIDEIHLPIPTAEFLEWQRLFCPLRKVIRSALGPQLPATSWMDRGDYWDTMEPEIGKLYWPTGANRWAVGFFLVTEKQIGELASKIGEAVTLTMGDEDNEESEYFYIQPEMFMLPPVPLAYTDSTGDPATQTGCFLLTLVDERFYWRWKNIEFDPETREDEEHEWTQLWDAIADELPDVDLQDRAALVSDTVFGGSGPATAYDWNTFNPTPDKLIPSRRRTVGDMLEMLAVNTGRRVARWVDGTLWVETPTQAGERLTDNQARPFKRLSGMENLQSSMTAWTKCVLPKEVEVSFPRIHAAAGLPYGDFVSVIKQVTGGREEGSRMYVDTYAAQVSTKDTSPPTNQSDLEAIAQRIADDLAAWWNKGFRDVTFSGICDWTPCGYDDVVEFTYQLDCCQTRVRSMMFDAGENGRFNHAKKTHPDPYFGEVWEGELAASLARDGDGTMYVRRNIGGTWTEDTSVALPIQDNAKIPADVSPIPSGANVTVALTEGDRKVPVLIAFDCDAE